MGATKSTDPTLPAAARRALLLIALAVAGGFAPAADAQIPGYSTHNQSVGVWRRMDACKRQAWKEHPDYTRDDNLKRDQAVKRCLEANNLPPIAPLAPQPPDASSGSSR